MSNNPPSDPGHLACRHGCDHPQPVQTHRGWICVDCWVHRGIISLLIPWENVWDKWENAA